MFIGRTDAEAETPIFCPPDAKNWLIWKDPDGGKDWRREEKGMTEDKIVGWHHRLNKQWVNSGSWWWTGRPGVLCFMGSQRVRHNWTKLNLLPPPDFSSLLPSIRIFSNKSVFHIRWPKYWSFNFSISPSNKCSGLISCRIDWLDLLAVQGTLKSLLQHHSSKASILHHSAFFIVQLSHPYMTTGKTIALTRWAFVDKVMSLIFNMLSRLVSPPLTHR